MLQRGFTPEAIRQALRPEPKPEPPPQPKSRWINWEAGIELVKIGTQLGWAYYKRQQYWVELEGKVLASAREHQGCLSEAQFLAALQFKTRDAKTVSERLCAQGICLIEGGRYLFPCFLRPAFVCEYCDQPRTRRDVSCTQCGAP
jgi:hypothetical protein